MELKQGRFRPAAYAIRGVSRPSVYFAFAAASPIWHPAGPIEIEQVTNEARKHYFANLVTGPGKVHPMVRFAGSTEGKSLRYVKYAQSTSPRRSILREVWTETADIAGSDGRRMPRDSFYRAGKCRQHGCPRRLDERTAGDPCVGAVVQVQEQRPPAD